MSDLRAGEEVLYEGRPSWRALMGFYLLGALLAAVAGVIVSVAASVGAGIGVGVIIACVVLIVGYARRLFTKYLITDQRLRISRGMVRRNVQETRLERVQNVNYAQGFIDRALNVGTVDFDTAATDDSEFKFDWVVDPEQVVATVHAAVERAEHQQL